MPSLLNRVVRVIYNETDFLIHQLETQGRVACIHQVAVQQIQRPIQHRIIQGTFRVDIMLDKTKYSLYYYGANIVVPKLFSCIDQY